MHGYIVSIAVSKVGVKCWVGRKRKFTSCIDIYIGDKKGGKNDARSFVFFFFLCPFFYISRELKGRIYFLANALVQWCSYEFLAWISATASQLEQYLHWIILQVSVISKGKQYFWNFGSFQLWLALELSHQGCKQSSLMLCSSAKTWGPSRGSQLNRWDAIP